jgi:hypothetical protein
VATRSTQDKPLKVVGETVADVLGEMDKRSELNLRIWKALGKTDPAHTKQFQRAGGFRGTAIKPIWITQRLTELFGPVGEGWGMDKPEYEMVHSQDGEVLVYCTVAGWYREAGRERCTVYGVGGDKAVAWVGRDNSRRMVADDEAFKKAFTDAIGNAFKFIGVGADVHMGLFEDSKYLAEVAAEFHPPANEEPKAGKRLPTDMSDTQLRGCIKSLIHNLNGVGSTADFEELMELPETKETVEQCARRFPAWYETGEGLPAEFKPLKKIIEETRKGLRELETAE